MITEDASTAPTISTQTTEGYKNSETTTTAITTTTTQTKTEIIQQLVSEAVTKVLVDQGVSNTEKVSENIVSKVVEGLKPTLTPSTIGKHSGVPQSITKPPCIYNPTPISELKKRHNLSVPFYNPTIRDCKLPIKRKSTDEYLSSWSSSTQSHNVDTNELTYKPTAINNDNNIIHDYIPTVKFDNNNLLNSYDDSNSSDYTKRKETYCPKVKKRREEYVPKKIKTPLQSVPQYDDMIVDEYNNDFDIFESNIIDKKNNLTEGKFSDDDDDNDKNIEDIVNNKKDSEMTTKEVQKMIKTVDDKAIVFSKNKDNDKNTIIKNDITSSRRNSSNSQSHKSSNESEKKKLDKENSKNHSDKNKKEHSSSLSKTDDKKNSKDHKHSNDNKHKSSSSSSSRHSSSKSSSKSSHREKESSSSSSSHRSKDKSHSSRHKKSSSKENEHDKSSSKNDKSKSSSSLKSDKSSSRSSDKKKSSTSSSSSSSSRDKKSSSSKNSNEKNKNGVVDDEDHLSNDNFESAFDNIDELLETSDSEHDVEEECLKIFQEYQESDHPRDVIDKKSSKNHQTEDNNEGTEEVGKKRVAHPSAATCSILNPGPSQPLKKRPNPQQKMYERWRLMKEAAAEKANVRASNIQEQRDNDIFISTKSQQVVGKAKIESKSIHVEPQVNGNGNNFFSFFSPPGFF